jgi:competence protein ComEC
VTAARPHLFVVCACGGLALVNVARSGLVATAVVAVTAAVAVARGADARITAVAAAVMVTAWCWGAVRADALDASVLAADAGRADETRLVVVAPPHRTRYALRMQAQVVRFGLERMRETVLLELPRGRAPPQGAILETIATVRRPRGAANGFDEAKWLHRHGIHVVVRAIRWRVVGHRRGIASVPDRLRVWVRRGATEGLAGERRAIVAGIVLGDDQGLSDDLRDRFRAAGLYHLLAVSGQNVALVAAGVLGTAWLLGVSRIAAQIGALAAIVAYVLAVGAQPSVVRAGVAGCLGSLAWLAGRLPDRWYAFTVGAFVLLAWNPYTLLDPGFQLSLAAVSAIFVLAPPLRFALEGYPMPRWLREVVAISAACGVATAPVAWFQFHTIPLLTIPANALAAPVVAPLLGLALLAAVIAPVLPAAAAMLAWTNGWCAAYLVACARIVGGLPVAQVRSTRAAAALAACVLTAAAYAWRRGRPQARVRADRHRPAEDPDGARPPAGPVRR